MRTRPPRSGCEAPLAVPSEVTGRGDRRRTSRRSGRPAAKKELGQHFLVDENLLGVIGRLAKLGRDDVVLEVGPGLGVLTTYLADRVARVHAVELDRSLEPRLREALAERGSVELHLGDALRLDLASLDPPPTKLVSNLPYNVATPLVVESLDGLPSLELWCVMVQREVADRFFAQPSTKAYGAVSVLVQLAAERTGFHPVSREVFRPRPNVESALVAFRRVELPAGYPRVKELVAAAFAHRRKRLVNSLELAGLADRDAAAAALEAVGRDRNARAEELTPPEFVALARAFG
jgi:16S rRNA (adenine1518-N6/adenine1519-N6)-dimethyltransferase